ncbi:hypothetical protein BHE75_03527 [Sphingomonas haloaromaticamans]|uniref:Uncharacterized protein n=1 Tax=Edaphosphingomonas haloaromaticamans TaxID=653954 RepID=A0A1S1HGV1_9SPHN|nr:hypothetical protein [Sphingomonas sp.]OHT21519.1 hypothetical protein BHE75_03527 [Sphingomonas haloaromaticamans]
MRVAAQLGLVLGGWLAIMAGLPFVGPAGRQVAVVGDAAHAARAIAAAGGVVVERRRGATLARSDDRGFALALYRHGAPLVIEGRIAAGCFSRSATR